MLSWRTSVLYGMVCWLAYGLLEHALFCMYDFAVGGMVFDAAHWRQEGMLWIAYAICGAASGALARLISASRVQIVVALSLALAVAVNLMVWHESRFDIVSLALVMLVAVALLTAFRIPSLVPLAAPWTVSALLLGPAWIVKEAYTSGPAWARVAAQAGIVLAIAAFAMFVGGERAPRLRFHLATLCGLAVALGIGAAMLDHPLDVSKLKSTGAADRKPNVLLVVMDTVRADHLSTYGYNRNTSPNLTALASRATLFRHAMAASDITLTTHASMFTGLYPQWHGAHYGDIKTAADRPLLAERYQTMAEILGAKGYATAAVAANYVYLQPAFQLDQGFQAYDWRAVVPVVSVGNKAYLRWGLRRLLDRFIDTASFDRVTRAAGDINRAAFTVLDRNSRPFFLFLNYMDAHAPYVPPAPYNAMFPGRERRMLYQDYPDLGSSRRDLTAHERGRLESQYDGGIAYLDAQLGKLMAELQRRGLFDDTLIMITADHGEAFGERRMIGHGAGNARQDQLHIPLLIKFPRQTEKQVVDAPASQVDLLPTVLDVLSIPAPGTLQGQALNQSGGPQRLVISEAFSPSLKRRYFERAVFNWPIELISISSGKQELYNVAEDAGERHNLYRAGDASADAMRASLDAFLKTAPRRSGPDSKLDSGALQRLKSLGYVQ